MLCKGLKEEEQSKEEGGGGHGCGMRITVSGVYWLAIRRAKDIKEITGRNAKSCKEFTKMKAE